MNKEYTIDLIKNIVKDYGTLEEDMLEYVKETFFKDTKDRFYVDSTYFDTTNNKVELNLVSFNSVGYETPFTMYINISDFIEYVSNNKIIKEITK